MTHPFRALTALGQSVWYDNLSREFLRTGELKKTIEQDGVSGVTSNPTIFEKAISSDRVYDHAIHELVDTGRQPHEIYEELVAADVRDVADLLYPVYEDTDAADGYANLEVSPHLAYDTAGTVERALRLRALVDRKNLMIKVPATLEGLKAMSDLLAQGVNVNATLIFSQEQYADAVAAYLEGVERWIEAGGDPRQLAGAASFFVSRVDTAIDEILREIVDPKVKPAARSLLGKAGIANAKIAYETYQEVFNGPRFALFREKGVRPQRIVWASTSTKDPDYTDTYYVEALIGSETVTTLPKIKLRETCLEDSNNWA
jgi:transaldolase